jgi:hypothetical protein
MEYVTDFFLPRYIVRVQFFWKFKFWFQLKDGLLEKKTAKAVRLPEKETADLKKLTDLVRRQGSYRWLGFYAKKSCTPREKTSMP